MRTLKYTSFFLSLAFAIWSGVTAFNSTIDEVVVQTVSISQGTKTIDIVDLYLLRGLKLAIDSEDLTPDDQEEYGIIFDKFEGLLSEESRLSGERIKEAHKNSDRLYSRIWRALVDPSLLTPALIAILSTIIAWEELRSSGKGK